MYNTGYVAGAIIVAGDRGYVKDCSFSNNKARHMEFYDYVQRDNAGKVVKEVRYVYTAGAIKWDGDDGIFENPIFPSSLDFINDKNFINPSTILLF